MFRFGTADPLSPKYNLFKMSFQIDKHRCNILKIVIKKSHTNTKVQNIQKLAWKSDKELDIMVSKIIEEELQVVTNNKSNLLRFFSRSVMKPAAHDSIKIIIIGTYIKREMQGNPPIMFTYTWEWG